MAEIDESEVQKLFTIKQNQLKMVARRGYNIDREENILAIGFQDFFDAYIPFARDQNKSIREVLSVRYENEEGEKLFVYYADGPKDKQTLGVDEISDAIRQMDKYKTKRGILITPKALSSSAKKKIAELVSYNIYVFLEREMLYDPTEHFFTPKHRALSVEEQRNFLQRNNLSLDNFPIILTTDMISRYYGFLPGQVIEIHRTNLFDTIVQESLSYRVVKEDVKEL